MLLAPRLGHLCVQRDIYLALSSLFPLIDIPDYEIVWRSPAGSKFEAEAQRRVKDRLGKIVITAEYFLKHMPIVR